MTRKRIELAADRDAGSPSTMEIETGALIRPRTVIVERKGWGHPDTLADHLAEHLSRVYSRHTLERFGAVLHHNFDKLALLGGSSSVRYGGGGMIDPVRVQVNGRAAERFGDEKIAVQELLADAIRGFFAGRLPEVAGHLALQWNITANSSPGAVEVGEAASDRSVWFAPRSLEDLREHAVLLANDTSLGTGWAPQHPFETFVHELADTLSAPDGMPAEHAWWGSDVKVMAYATDDREGCEIDLVACVPQKSLHVESRDHYLRNRDLIIAVINDQVRQAFPHTRARVRVNMRDLPAKDELYLTWTGSSIESGDEGVVGRGNRVNGLITPLRAMNVEGVNGKNPVYHVGKLYNVAADRLARQLNGRLGLPVEVHLISATGQRLDRPWRILVRLGDSPDPGEAGRRSDAACEADVEELVRIALDGFPALTEEVLHGNPVFS